jgi:hypothetical protein
MTTHLVTFSDTSMSRSRALCISSALKYGVDFVAGPHYFDPGIEYRDGFTLEWLKSQPIYAQMGAEWWKQRGCGFWLWKPFLIDLVMGKLADGDILIYADAGVEFIDNVRYVVDRMRDDVWLFGNNWEHAHWCKADVVQEVWPRDRSLMFAAAYLDKDPRIHRWRDLGKQVQASVILFRVSDWSRKFVAEWLAWCKFSPARIATPDPYLVQDRYLIDDSPSIAPNHPEFREHRHDQAILTTLAYREGIKLHYWPAVYNKGGAPEFVYEKLPEYAGDDYPVLFSHHRRRNYEWA